MSNTVFIKIPHLKLTEQERDELYQIQSTLTYKEFYSVPQENLMKDGNYVIRDPNLPSWVYEKFKDILKYSKRILFLKNKGTITHTDINRKCSLTIPLKATTPTNFYESNSIIKLFHGNDTFLQNNEITHFVDWGEEWRYFLQISFKHTYKKIYRTLWQKK
jgi:hypothetical protein|tara:strand:- start:59 stop:541 length:483 start_codon:yes stop_codon:yes gene_type:complete